MAEPQKPAPTHAGFGPELRIDWLPATELDGHLPGRLGITFLPGKRGPSQRYPGHIYRRDTAADLAAMRSMGVIRLILLVEDAELARWGDAAIVELGVVAGIDVRRHPIRDGAPPASSQEMDRILDEIDEARPAGDVAVACMGGVGRAGTVAACALVRAGLPADRAIARVRALRHPTAVETHAQERFVRAYDTGASPKD
jgi:protein-tyrosine phosphatase